MNLDNLKSHFYFLGDKRQVTGGLAANYWGEKLKVQLILKGLTRKCLPKKLKKGWAYSFTDSHWQDVKSTIQLLKEIIIPYYEEKKRELNLPKEQFSLLIWDVWYNNTILFNLTLFSNNLGIHIFIQILLNYVKIIT